MSLVLKKRSLQELKARLREKNEELVSASKKVGVLAIEIDSINLAIERIVKSSNVNND